MKIIVQIVEWHVKEGANYHQGLVCAKGLVGVAVTSVAVFLQALLATMRLVLAMLASPPAIKPENALN